MLEIVDAGLIGTIKRRLGIAEIVDVYDQDIALYIKDCQLDMLVSGVPESLAMSNDHEGVATAITLYVSAYLGSDRTDTEKYLDLYRKKVFRLALEGE